MIDSKMYAEVYRGSGRYTGRTEKFDEPPGEGWVSLAGMTVFQFDAALEADEHDQCHSPDQANDRCRYCVEAGWGRPH